MRPTNRLLASLKSKPLNDSNLVATTSSAPKASKQQTTRFRKAPLPSLEHFIQRQRVIHLYRDILRRLYTIPPAARHQRDEFMTHARTEFERHRNVKDISQIRYLISVGKADMKGWERMIQELASR